MINDQLLRYVKQQLSLNVSKEVIFTNLKSQGWTDADINEVFTVITPVTAPTSAPTSSSVVDMVTPNIPQSPTDFSNTAHTKSKKLFSIILILVLLGLVGGGAYAYYAGFFNFKKTETFEQVFTKVMDKINSQKYSKSTVEGSMAIKDDKTITQLNLPAGAYPQINFSTDTVLFKEDLNDPSKNKVLTNANFKLVNIVKDPISAKVDFLMPEPMIFYMKLNELTGLPEGAPSLGASLLQGKWWKVDIKALIKNFAGAEADKLLESTKKGALSKEKVEQIKAIVQKYKDVIHIEKLPDGEIEGASAYHWSVVLDKTKLAPMLAEISNMTQEDVKEKEEVKISDIEAGLKMIDIKHIELFVQKRDYLPAQVKFSVGISNESKDLGILDMSLVVDGSDFVEIKAPAESTDILYLMGPLIQSSLGTAQQKGKEASIKANLSSMRAQAELFWDTNKGAYSGFCASKELKTARKSIEDNGGTGFVCKEASQKYAIGVKLFENSGNWCVDSTGVSKATATLPSGTACPAK